MSGRSSQSFPYGNPGNTHGNGNDWSLSQLFNMSFLASVFSSQSLWSGLAFFILGTVVESGRRFAQWLMDRFNFREWIFAVAIIVWRLTENIRAIRYCKV